MKISDMVVYLFGELSHLQVARRTPIHRITRLNCPAAGGQLLVNVFAGEFFGFEHDYGVGVIVISGPIGRLGQTA